jgi:hypothetical protein
MTRTHILLAILAAMIALASVTTSAAAADIYPVSGRWTYANASASGPAPECSKPTMEFRGAQRFDTGGGVPAYRNVRVEQSSSTIYRVVDEFFNVQARGRVSYTLRIRDKDHLQIDYDQGGKSFVLRRCA